MAEINTSSQSGRGGRRRKRSATRIDMTPMVDLAFLLLTFFILTSVLTKPFVMKIDMPDRNTSGPTRPIPKEKLITLVLGENDVVYWYQGVDHPELHVSDFSSTGIRKILFEKKTAIDRMHVFIKPTQKSRYKNVVDILDEMLITQITDYSLVKASAEDDQLIAAYKSK